MIGAIMVQRGSRCNDLRTVGDYHEHFGVVKMSWLSRWRSPQVQWCLLLPSGNTFIADTYVVMGLMQKSWRRSP
ncbi:MAG: hypothetical protein ACLRP3_08365 [Escherichia sp.]